MLEIGLRVHHVVLHLLKITDCADRMQTTTTVLYRSACFNFRKVGLLATFTGSTSGHSKHVCDRDYIMRMLYKNCYWPAVTPCCGTVITHRVYVVCYFRDIYPFIYFIVAMYVHHLGLYCILFSRFLISKIKYSFAVDKVVIKESYYYYSCRPSVRPFDQ